MSQKINYVELPLDPEYVTQDGAYMAGYIWGQHVRSEKDARQDFPGDTPLHEDFYKGVADGYNDQMNKMSEETKQNKENEKSNAVLSKLIADVENLHRSGAITLDGYRTAIDNLLASNL